jgi:hypothetical protein
MNTILKSRLGQCGLVATSLIGIVFLIAATHGPSEAATRAPSEAEKTKQNITRVLKADETLAKQRDSAVPHDAPPSVIALCIEHYCDGLENVDMSDCPADFRVAYREHMRAWRQMDAAIKELPDSFMGGFLEGFVNSLEGELDGGASRIRGDLKNASSNVEGTWSCVEQTGAKYGAAL